MCVQPLGVMMWVNFDDRVDAAFAMWLAAAQTTEELHKIGREVHRILGADPCKVFLATKITYAVAFLERLVELSRDDLFREFCAGHVDMVQKVSRACVDRAEPLVTSALADWLGTARRKARGRVGVFVARRAGDVASAASPPLVFL